MVIEKIDEDEKEQLQSPIKLQVPQLGDQTSSSDDDSEYLRKVQQQRELEE